jgi:hypothetical protein
MKRTPIRFGHVRLSPCLFAVGSHGSGRCYWLRLCRRVSNGQDRAPELDAGVLAFLDRHRGMWRDLNVPESDGRVLHDLVLKHKFTRALEIGTSTGHSGIWIAWALAKRGGRLTTVEIDPGRHQTALANFKEAGLAPYIDARLGDAHEIVPALPGPFDCSRTPTRSGRRLAEARAQKVLHGPQRVGPVGRSGNPRLPGSSQDPARCCYNHRQSQPRGNLDKL